MKSKKTFFKKRVQEPKLMDKLDFKSFLDISNEKYLVWFTPLVDSIMEIYGSTEGKVLDLACGPGFLTKELSARSSKFDIFCLDSSKHAISLAKKNCEGIKNVHFFVGRVEKLPYENEAFDLIICKDSFHHFKSAKRALKEILRVLKNEGVLYIQDLRRDLPSYFIKQTLPLDNPIKKLQYYSVRASYTKPEIISIIKSFHPKYFKVFTRILDLKTKIRYSKKGINLVQLKNSFQSRYVLVVRK